MCIFQLLNEMSGEGRFSGAQWPSSNQPYGPDEKLPKYWLGYNGSLPYEDRMEYVISWMTHETEPANLVFMYFEQPDSEGHASGPNSMFVEQEVRNMDNITNYLLGRLEQVGLAGEVNLIILSDHGMAEVTNENFINITQVVNFDEFTVYGSSPVLHILPAEGKTCFRKKSCIENRIVSKF